MFEPLEADDVMNPLPQRVKLLIEFKRRFSDLMWRFRASAAHCADHVMRSEPMRTITVQTFPPLVSAGLFSLSPQFVFGSSSIDRNAAEFSLNRRSIDSRLQKQIFSS